MSNFDIVKDVEGKDYLIFDSSELYDESNIGNKLEDFEFLSKLGEGSYGQVYKVLSKLNNKVYAMKKLDMLKILRKEGARAYELTYNESTFLQILNHPHVVKYYKNFEIGKEYLYIIIEYIPNGSLKNYIDAQAKFKKHIPEELMWNIFLQCMEALAYIHSQGVIHRDIKPENLLLDNNMVVKIGDFGVSALLNEKDGNNQYVNAKYNMLKNKENLENHGTIVGTRGYMSGEIEDQEYDQKVDVYSMGISFFEMCYFFNPLLENKKKENKFNYSKELTDIIDLMIEDDKDKRKTSEEIFNIIKKEYTKKYLKNTSINSVIRCLCSFDYLSKKFLNLKLNDINKKPITKGIIDSINCFSDLDKWKDKINYFYQIFVTENPKLLGTKEIDPRFVFAFLLRQLHKELSETNEEIIDNLPHLIIAGEQAAKTTKIEVKFKYINDINQKFNSFIRNSFMGLMKQTNFCLNCQLKTYTFQSYFFVTFDMEKITKKEKISEIDLEDCFYFQNTNFEKKNNYCNECLNKTGHQICKQFYLFPKLLIISIQRGNNYNYKMPIVVNEILDLNDDLDTENQKYVKTKYNLIGYVGRTEKNENEKFFYIAKKDATWFYGEGNEFKKIKSPLEANSYGDIILAFYQLNE